MRSSWDQHAMLLAEAASLRSEDPFKKVGACVLGHNNEVLSVAYNGLASGVEADEKFWSDRDGRRLYMVHAESNALAQIHRGEGRLLACTLLPCSSCATNISAYGIKKVIYKEAYDRDEEALKIFKFYGIDCKQIT